MKTINVQTCSDCPAGREAPGVSYCCVDGRAVRRDRIPPPDCPLRTHGGIVLRLSESPDDATLTLPLSDP